MKSAQYYKDLASDQRQRSIESFDRCDTDGFLSQWANDIGAQLNDKKAEIAASNGKHEFLGLYHNNRRIKAKQVTMKNKFAGYGTVTQWLIHEDDRELTNGRRWIPCGENSRIQKQMNLSEKIELASAWADIKSSGTGLSGNCWVSVFRTGDEWGGDSKLV